MATTQSTPVLVQTRGLVPTDMRSLAAEKVAAALRHTTLPLLSARVTLEQAPDPAIKNPALASAHIDLNGRQVLAHAAGLPIEGPAREGQEATGRPALVPRQRSWRARTSAPRAGSAPLTACDYLRDDRRSWPTRLRPGQLPGYAMQSAAERQGKATPNT